jgi:hypothetical protein
MEVAEYHPIPHVQVLASSIAGDTVSKTVDCRSHLMAKDLWVGSTERGQIELPTPLVKI